MKKKYLSLIFVCIVLIALLIACVSCDLTNRFEQLNCAINSSTTDEVFASTSLLKKSVAKNTVMEDGISTLNDETYTSLGVPLSEHDLSTLDCLFGVGKYEVYSGFSNVVVCNILNDSTRSDVLILRNLMSSNLATSLYWVLIPKENVFVDTGVCEVSSIVLNYDGNERSPFEAYPQFLLDDFHMYQFVSLLKSKQMTVTYNLVRIESAVPLPDAPVKEGYHFVGWYYDSEFTQPYYNEPIYADTQLYAKYEINKYTVEFNSNGGNTIANKQVDWNTAVELPTPTRDGYGFDGWYLSDGTKYTNQPIKSNTTLTARWYRNRFTVMFDTAGGLEVASQDVMLNDKVSPVTPVRNGYIFLGWYMANGVKYENQPVTDDMTLTAHWEIKHYTVTFYVDGAVYTTMDVEHGSQLVKIANERNLIVMSVSSLDSAFSSESLETDGITTELSVTAVKMDGADKVVNTVKQNYLTIIGSVVFGVALIAVIVSICGRVKHKKKR